MKKKVERKRKSLVRESYRNTMQFLLLEATDQFSKSIGKIKIIVNLDDGTKKNPESISAGFLFNLNLVPSTWLKKDTEYAAAKAAKEFHKELLNFIVGPFRSALSNIPETDYFPGIGSDVIHTFPKGHEYESSSHFRFNKKINVAIRYPLELLIPNRNIDEWLEVVANSLKGLAKEKLFKPTKNEPWKIV